MLMPANLPPQYLEAEKKFRQAHTNQEKLEALEEMLSIIPKHKGTEKLQAEIKQRISKLRKQATREKKSQVKTHHDPYFIERAGAAQIAIVGPPNSGKSTFLATLTRARPEIADFPFSTYYPTPGMMEYQDIQIQLIDFPPIADENIEGNFTNALRRADAILLIADATSKRLLEDIEIVEKALGKSKISFLPRPLPSLSWTFLPLIIMLNKVETPSSQENLALCQELWQDKTEVIGISLKTKNKETIERIKEKIFQLAGIIRIYSKPPGLPPDLSRPFILKKGETVKDLAEQIHRDIAQEIKGARVWGSGKFDGQLVSVDHPLEDKDIVEIHT